MSTIEVRPAVPEDAPALAAVLARAFASDPCMCWVFRDDETRPGYLDALFAGALGMFLPHDATYTTSDLAGAAIWVPPGKYEGFGDADEDEVALMEAIFGAESYDRLRTFLGTMAEHHPSTEHHYLAILGADAGRQGQGIGTATMRPVLDRCDAEGVPAYLESSNGRNVPLYERNGFRVTDVVDLPDGPPVWLMWREPRPRAK